MKSTKTSKIFVLLECLYSTEQIDKNHCRYCSIDDIYHPSNCHLETPSPSHHFIFQEVSYKLQRRADETNYKSSGSFEKLHTRCDARWHAYDSLSLFVSDLKRYQHCFNNRRDQQHPIYLETVHDHMSGSSSNLISVILNYRQNRLAGVSFLACVNVGSDVSRSNSDR